MKFGIKPDYLSNIMIFIGLLLVFLSIFAPASYFSLPKDILYYELWHNISFQIECVSLLILPLIIVLIYKQKLQSALWLSLVFITIQTFPQISGIYKTAQDDFIIEVSMLAFAILLNCFWDYLGKLIKYILSIILALFIAAVTALTIVSHHFDLSLFQVSFIISTIMLFCNMIRLKYRIFLLLLSLYYLCLPLIMFINHQCNVRFIGDMGIADWSFSNLCHNCLAYCLLVFSGILLNLAIVLKILRKNNIVVGNSEVNS